MNGSRTLFTFVATAAALAATEVSAQSLLSPEAPAQGIWMEGSRTSFWFLDQEVPTAVWFLGGRLPVSARFSAVADLPFSRARVNYPGTSESNSVLGNPYVGVEFRATPELLLSAGTRLPLTSADEESFADVFAILADPQRIEAFAMDVVPASVLASYTAQVAPGLSLRARGGTTVIVHTGRNAPDPDVMLDYGLLAGYTLQAVRTGFGFSGRWIATHEDAESVSDASIHYAGLTLDVRVLGVRPGLSVRVPLDDDHRELVGASWGAYLQIPLR
jgi:hypothetical protein